MSKKNGKHRKLSPQQKLFADEYLIDLNATAAYKRAKYKAKNDAVAASAASDLLRNPKVAEYLSIKTAAIAKANEISATRILLEAKRLALSDVRKLFDADGQFKEFSELDDETAAAVASVEVDELFEGRNGSRKCIGYTKKIKLWDKNSALDKLFRYLALYKDLGTKDNPISVTVIHDDIPKRDHA